MQQSRRRTIIYTVLGLLVGIFLFATALSSFYIDVLWFNSLNYAHVFWKIVKTRFAVGAVGGAVVAGILFASLMATRFSVVNLPGGLIPEPFARLLRPRTVTYVFLGFSLLIGILSGLNLGAQWPVVELFRNMVPFGVTDPLFGKDAGFYVFGLPFYQMVLQTLSVVTVLSLVAAGAMYLASGAVAYVAARVRIHPRARRHLAFLAAALFALKAVSYYLDAFALLQSPRGAAFGASYADIHAHLPALRILAVLALAGAAAAVATAFTPTMRWLYAAVGTLAAASILLGAVWPGLLQYFVVTPNELARERPYIAYNIEYTRQAYGLSDVDVKEYPATQMLDWSDIAANPGTVENIRLWDVRPLLTTYRQRQNIRQYYNFHDVDVDRYTLNGLYQQVMLAPRELDHTLLPPQAQTWVNNHLKFTHGYGVVMSPASRVAMGGQPDFLIRDIPPQSTLDKEVTRPELYFGEIISRYAIVLTEEMEFDYPVGDTIAESFYEGTAGIPISGFLNRLAFALHFGDRNILLTGALTPESRIIINRQVVPRARKVAPFLQYDSDPYLVIDDGGRLFWMIDAYTTARGYPYSEPYVGRFAPGHFRGINYIRNSVKVTVDAYNGDVKFYVFDDDDPVIATYQNVFPGVFVPADEMPEDLRRHARYPEDLFRVQSDMYTTYHMTNPVVFYQNEDVWALPRELFEQEFRLMDPYYLIMQLPDEEEPEFLLMLPFTPGNRENMIAWLAGRSDGDKLGTLTVFTLPKDRQIFGPAQIEDRINQNADIARDLALWSQRGTRVIRGSLLVIPLADALLYVEPLFLRSEEGGLPELRRVIVTYGDRQPVMDETLELALARLFGPGGPELEPGEDEEGPPGPGRPADEDVASLIAEAGRLYQRAEEALRAGDFAAYGRHIEELGRVLDRLERLTGGGEAGEPVRDGPGAGGEGGADGGDNGAGGPGG